MEVQVRAVLAGQLACGQDEFFEDADSEPFPDTSMVMRQVARPRPEEISVCDPERQEHLVDELREKLKQVVEPVA